MADGLHAGDTVGDVIEQTLVNIIMDYNTDAGANRVASEKVNAYYSARDSAKLFDNLCGDQNEPKHEGLLLATCEEDCRKKRCVDRYDSSESSDSGVAVLSCTDCSGSSTASSDITDPGSPFSTASNHSEDSGGSHSSKMPPAQSAHHPPWLWTAEDGPPPSKRPHNDKTAFAKGLKTGEEAPKKPSTPCHNASDNKLAQTINGPATVEESSPINNNNYKTNKKVELGPKMQQGKITEYFKTQVKSNGMRKQLLKIKSGGPLINQVNHVKTTNVNRKDTRALNVLKKETKTRKFSPTVPRKILPAPTKLQETLPANNPMTNMHPFTPTMTLTAVSFPSNLTYLHAKAPKPADNLFLPQFTAITNEKVSTIPLINRNAMTGMPIATLNNFNCVKLNATVVPIVNINALPPRINGPPSNITLSVETAVPTVLPARPKVADTTAAAIAAPPSSTLPKQYGNDHASSEVTIVQSSWRMETTMTEQPYRTEECQTHQQDQPQEPPDDKRWTEESQNRIQDQKSPSPTDSDSGFSSRGSLEISVDEPVTEQPKKSPILSQPKTIRFPAIKPQKHKDEGRELGKSPPQSSDGRCRWDECVAQFDTSGALLEHLQVVHVISQSRANQEQYVCLWKGCKVHGRTSCSISWLERHVLAHAGTKPFRCIVDGCGHRFNSQLMLERHVNNHFNSDNGQTASAKKSVENGPVKLFKRNGRIIRFRRQPWSARMFDFIDSGIMEGLQHKLLKLTQVRTLGQMDTPGETVSLQSQILARRTDAKGSKELLVRWQPPDVLPDEWIPEKEYKPTKTWPIPSLSPEGREALGPSLFPNTQRQPGQKHSRKPLKST